MGPKGKNFIVIYLDDDQKMCHGVNEVFQVIIDSESRARDIPLPLAASLDNVVSLQNSHSAHETNGNNFHNFFSLSLLKLLESPGSKFKESNTLSRD